MPDVQTVYQELIDRLRQTALLASCAHVLSWDEQTHLPPNGAEHRANQLSVLMGLVHEQATAPRIGELLNILEGSGALGPEDSPLHVNVREARRNFDRATRLPQQLVEELSRVTTLAQQAWVGARKNNKFVEFAPWLEKIIRLKREEAEAVGYDGGVPYDALLDEYEPGAKTQAIQAVFTPLRQELVQLVASVASSKKRTDADILTRRYPIDAQKTLATDIAKCIGFNFEAGRLDESAHPFCSGIGPGDCRMTTRYDERHFPSGFFGVLHEAGHGLYEQGLDPEAFGTPVGEFASLGIHESQSRMWENFVGRSRPFWEFFFPRVRNAFPETLANVSLDEFYRAVNDVRPSYIRVEADEVTYNLHIMLRFELEQELVAGNLQPADLPSAWNARFTEYFGITPPDDARGCLQDIHWSGGMVGYFPTYALGNMYAAQFYAAAQDELGEFSAQFARGEFQPLREWLNRNIHRRGRQYRAERLVQVVTGKPLSHEPLVAHLRSKFGELYGF